MAIVQLKQVEVVRVNQTGHGVQVVEKWQSKGAERSQRYTVWFDAEHGLQVGDRIDVSGFLGVAVEPWTDREGKVRHSAKVSVNSPRLDRNEALSPPAGENLGSHEAGSEPWASDSVPF